MKITPDEILTNLHNTKKSQSVNSSEQKFDEILRGQLGAQAPQTGKTDQPPAIPSLTPLSLSILGDGDRLGNIQRVERFLDIIETYQTELKNPSTNLRELTALVSMMEEETNKVIPLVDSLPEGSALKDIMNRAVVTSTVEMIKFNRGDYAGQ